MARQYKVDKFSKDEDKGTEMLNQSADGGWELKYVFESGSGFLGIFERQGGPSEPIKVEAESGRPETKKRGRPPKAKEEVTVTETQLELPTPSGE